MVSRCLRWCVVCWLGFFAPAVHAQQILITEFMAVNDGSLVDAEDDEPDWIELHHTGSSAVDLAGWYLTDDAGDLRSLAPPSKR